MIESGAFVRWFRASSPYIHAHRGKTFVVFFGGEALLDENFPDLIHDFALLHGLGIRLVLVHGIRPQIEQRLQRQGISSRYHRGLRITDTKALECVEEAAGQVRAEIEARLSMGIADSPMEGLRLRVASGNFVIAKPLGVFDGIDFEHTGEVRRVDRDNIRTLLDGGNLVLVSPLGYSPTGEVFNLGAEQVAMAIAGNLGADKFLLLMEQDCLSSASTTPIQQVTTSEARLMLQQNSFTQEIAQHIEAAVKAVENGVTRAHLINRQVNGALLLELFTRDGIGTLISAEPFESLRSAHIEDIGGILELIVPLEQEGILVKRSREKMEMEIADFCVIERDGLIIGCAALHSFPDAHMGELACLALHPDYRGRGRGQRLLEAIEDKAKRSGLTQLFVLTTRTTHWFLERGFRLVDFHELPVERKRCYNYKRNSKILLKSL